MTSQLFICGVSSRILSFTIRKSGRVEAEQMQIIFAVHFSLPERDFALAAHTGEVKIPFPLIVLKI